MAFSFYKRLSPAQKRVYRASDEIRAIRLPQPAALQAYPRALAQALAREDRATVEVFCQRLADGVAAQLRVPRPEVSVLAVRPHNPWGELHGLYAPAAPPERPRAVIVLWMRTAKQRRVVAFRTFLRTLLHELCHHLDYTWLRLPDSFHTEGFYKRESSLFHQLVP
jgi:hypothetical protein